MRALAFGTSAAALAMVRRNDLDSRSTLRLQLDFHAGIAGGPMIGYVCVTCVHCQERDAEAFDLRPTHPSALGSFIRLSGHLQPRPLQPGTGKIY
ncbi:MAG TPA: hypothetical protein VIU82_19690 [Bosea sp. (in: a-proteobacteria)]